MRAWSRIGWGSGRVAGPGGWREPASVPAGAKAILASLRCVTAGSFGPATDGFKECRLESERRRQLAEGADARYVPEFGLRDLAVTVTREHEVEPRGARGAQILL